MLVNILYILEDDSKQETRPQLDLILVAGIITEEDVLHMQII